VHPQIGQNEINIFKISIKRKFFTTPLTFYEENKFSPYSTKLCGNFSGQTQKPRKDTKNGFFKFSKLFHKVRQAII
jgi:hypothetical protein